MKRERIGDEGEVKVPRAVLNGLEAVRQSGSTNMFDRPVVVRLALEMGYAEAAFWIEEHRTEYAKGIFHGFLAADELGEDR